MSQEIRRLERFLGTSLFDRSTRTVTLTEAGEALLENARALGAAAGVFVARARRLTARESCAAFAGPKHRCTERNQVPFSVGYQ